VLRLRLQAHQVDDVDHPHLQLGQVLPQQRYGGEGFQRRYVAGAGEHDIGGAVVVAGPVPDAQTPGAVCGGVGHPQPLWRGLLAGHDDVDVVAAAQAVVGHREQGVGVRRQVHPDHFGLLVHHVVDEAGVLVGEAVVVLPPHVRGEQVVERWDGPPPGQVPGDLEPLRVLVEHRVDEVDEGFVAGEQAMPAGEQVALQPALAGVLGEHLHHPAVPGQVHVGRLDRVLPVLAGDLVDRAEPVGLGLVGSEDPEVAVRGVVAHHIPQEGAQHPGRLGHLRAGGVDLDGVVPEVGQLQRPGQ
jgi:hypothetical protein